MTATQRLYNAMATIAALCLLSCSSAREKYVVGVSQCSEDIWRDKLCREIREATYTTDDIRLAIASASDDDRRQSAQIDSLAGLGIDLLIVSPNQLNTVTPAIDRAYDSGIPVILFDRKTGSGKYTAFIGADNVKIGRTMGEYVAARLGGRGTVAEITGLEGSSPAIERHRGFAEALARHPGIRIVAAERGDWQEGSGRKAAERIFASGLRPDFIFAHNDRMAHGAWKAARRHGLIGHTRFVGIDALPGKGGGISLVRDGVLEASYIYPTRGDLVCRLARSILAGKPYERDNYMKAALVTKDNAETMLLQAEEMGHMSGRIEELHGMMDSFFAQYSHQKVYFILCSLILLLATATLAVLYADADLFANRQQMDEWIERQTVFSMRALLLRADLRYEKRYSTPKKDCSGVYTMAGYTGRLVFGNVSAACLPVLAFASALGVGGNINYGLGSFRLRYK